MSDKVSISKGLAGVIFDTTAISKPFPDEKKLIYRGYYVDHLAVSKSYEEVMYLILHGELPNSSELREFNKLEKSFRSLPPLALDVCKVIEARVKRDTNASFHPMDQLKLVLAAISTELKLELGDSREENIKIAINYISKVATAVATLYRISKGLDITEPNSDKRFSENFLSLTLGENYNPDFTKPFDGSLTMYAEHSFNASTFTARVVTSTLSDIGSSLVSAVAALKGPLHGGANEAVMHTLLEIGSADNAESWLEKKLANKERVMGFGHRLYHLGDSRVPQMKKFRDQVANTTGDKTIIPLSDRLEELFVKKKNIYPNLDFPAGPTYYMMGYDIPFFTPIFVVARAVGWCAHCIEQYDNNKLVRPSSLYIGHSPRDL